MEPPRNWEEMQGSDFPMLFYGELAARRWRLVRLSPNRISFVALAQLTQLQIVHFHVAAGSGGRSFRVQCQTCCAEMPEA